MEEKENQNKTASERAGETIQTQNQAQNQVQNQAQIKDKILLSQEEAAEYHAFKRQKRVEEAKAALQKSEGEFYGERHEFSYAAFKKLCESAKKIGSCAVRVPSGFLPYARALLGESGVQIDCLVGGYGETATKVKAYECKYAFRQGAREISLVLSPSKIKEERWGEIKKEIKKIAKKCKKALLKVCVGAEVSYSQAVKISAMIAESGGKFLSLPFFSGVESLKRDIGDRVMLEVSKVQTVADYKTLLVAGVERIATDEGEEIASMLLKEAEKTPLIG